MVEKFKDVLESNIPVVVCFYTPWCGACRRMDPIIGELATKYKGKIKFAVLDATKYPQAAAEYYVHKVPTYILFKDGTPQGMQVGTARKEDFDNWLSKWETR